MIFSDRKLLFIHVPKTGGNFITRAFIEASDDALVAQNDVQDGVDRFEVNGPATRRKHQTLAEYRDVLGDALSGFTVVAVVRPPLERLISLHFSPNRWLRRADATGKADDQPAFDPARFKREVKKAESISQILDLSEKETVSLSEPIAKSAGAQIRLVPFDHLRDGMLAVAREFGLPTESIPDRRINTSARRDGLKEQLARDPSLMELIASSHHAQDLRFFQAG